MSWDSCSSGCPRHLATFCFSPFPWTQQYFLLKLFRHDCHSVFRRECICVLYQSTRLGLFFQPLLCGRGCLEGGQGNICVLKGRKQEPSTQVPVQPLQMWPERDAYPFFHGALWHLGIGGNTRWKCNINTDHHIRYFFIISDVEGDVYFPLKALLNLFSWGLENNCRFHYLPTLQVH